jgi:hypothetical protein
MGAVCWQGIGYISPELCFEIVCDEVIVHVDNFALSPIVVFPI